MALTWSTEWEWTTVWDESWAEDMGCTATPINHRFPTAIQPCHHGTREGGAHTTGDCLQHIRECAHLHVHRCRRRRARQRDGGEEYNHRPPEVNQPHNDEEPEGQRREHHHRRGSGTGSKDPDGIQRNREDQRRTLLNGLKGREESSQRTQEGTILPGLYVASQRTAAAVPVNSFSHDAGQKASWKHPPACGA